MLERLDIIKHNLLLSVLTPLEAFITLYKISKDQTTVQKEIYQIIDPLFHKIRNGIEKLRQSSHSLGINTSDLKLYNLEEIKGVFSYINSQGAKINVKELKDSESLSFEEVYNRSKNYILSFSLKKWLGYPYIGYNYGNEYKKEKYKYSDLIGLLDTYNQAKCYFTNLIPLNDKYEVNEVEDYRETGDYWFEVFYDKRILAVCSVQFGCTMHAKLANSHLLINKYSISVGMESNTSGPIYGLRVFQGSTREKKFIPVTKIANSLDCIFQPQKDISVVKNILTAFKTTYGIDLKSEDIRWDPVRECYHLSSNVENNIFKYFIPHPTKNKELCKYTSLSTLVELIKSKEIRMNGILAMNDESECQYLKSCSKNFEEENVDDFYYLGNKKFITSFSKRIDNLNMWRHYGEELTGVCLVFDVNDSHVQDIIYVPSTSKEVQMAKHILFILKEDKIKFRICIIDNNQAFYKSNEYQDEDESRLLIQSEIPDGWQLYSNGLLTPYIQPSIYGVNKPDESSKLPKYDRPFDLRLKRILIGANMPNREYNYRQIKQLLNQYDLYGVEVEYKSHHKFR